MSRFKRILVPIDFSDGSRETLDRAADLVKGTDGELLLLHVVEPAVVPTVFAELSLAFLDLTEWTERAERLLGHLAEDQRARGLRVRSLVHPGYPSRDIIDTARAAGADLIVIGSSAHNAATHAFFGSTVERVVRKAHTPVLVTRPKAVAATVAGGLLIEAGLGIACLVVVAVLVAAALSSETLIARLLRTLAVSIWLSHVLAGAALLLLGYLGWRALAPIVRNEMNDRRTLP